MNPLQADPLTDVVEVGDVVCVVTSHLRVESCVHELVHGWLEGALPDWRPVIRQHAELLHPVCRRMIQLSYAWDSSAVSWENVFIETLVRVLTAWALEGQDPSALPRRVAAIVREGFHYAVPMAETLCSGKGVQPLTVEWVERCLRACQEYSIALGQRQ